LAGPKAQAEVRLLVCHSQNYHLRRGLQYTLNSQTVRNRSREGTPKNLVSRHSSTFPATARTPKIIEKSASKSIQILILATSNGNAHKHWTITTPALLLGLPTAQGLWN